MGRTTACNHDKATLTLSAPLHWKFAKYRSIEVDPRETQNPQPVASAAS